MADTDPSAGQHALQQARPWQIGLVGGVASGKSTVARALSERGALWLDCDKIAHQVLDQPEVVDALRSKFSGNVLDAAGRVNRRVLAGRVFGQSAAAVANRRWLEDLVHPRVRQRAVEQIAQAGSRYAAIIIDAPLLLEAGWGDMCDRILLVDTPESRRRQLAAQRGWSREEFEERERAQMPLDEKRRWATDVLRNDSTLEELLAQVEQFWQTLTGARPT